MDDLEIIMFKEIDDYSEKFYGLTFRQWIFAILIAVVVIPTYILLPKYTPINEDIASYIVILEAAIIGFFGFIKIHNLSAEHIAPYWYRHFFKFGKPLEYITDKEWEEMHDKKNKKNQKAVVQENVKPITEMKQELSTPKTVERPLENESKPQLTKKQLKQQRKQEKMLEKAKKKYGYMFDDEKISENSDVKQAEHKENDTVIVEETKIINSSNEVIEKETKTSADTMAEHPETDANIKNKPVIADVQGDNVVLDNTNEKQAVADNDNILNSFTPEQLQALKKMLNNEQN